MAKERLIRNNLCRCYFDGGIWVSSDGNHAYAIIYGKTETLKILYDSKGKFVFHPWGRKVSVAKAVLKCFCPPAPADGKIHIINYKDGCKENCDKSNLEWVEYHYRHNSEKSFKWDVGKGSVLTIFRDGTVKDGKQLLSYDISLYDSDMDLVDIIRPYVSTQAGKKSLDELMEIAGFINGDDAGLTNPKILHRDNDWFNFDSDNLEWVEESDPRCQAYMEQYKANRKEQLLKLNQGKHIPDYMLN